MAAGLSLLRISDSRNNINTSPTTTSPISASILDYGFQHTNNNNNLTYRLAALAAFPPSGNSSGVADSDSSTSWEDDARNRDTPWSFEFSVLMATVLSISAFLTVVGNAMVLTVIYRHRGMRTRTNILLVNLAIADLLVGVMVVPISITTLVEGRWVFGTDVCSLNGWVNALCLITSMHTLMWIGINKYYSICHTLTNPIQLCHIITMMIASWVWGAFCASITVTGLNTVSYKYGTSQCGPDYPKEARGYMFHTIVQVTVIILPFCIILFCYMRMFCEIRSHTDRLRIYSTMEEVALLKQNKNVAITLFIVLATFVIMALPYHVYATYVSIKTDKKNFSTYMNPIAYCFLYLNSMCNPIIYALRSPAFRDGYKEILCQTPNYVVRDGRSRQMQTSVNIHESTIVYDSPALSGLHHRFRPAGAGDGDGEPLQNLAQDNQAEQIPLSLVDGAAWSSAAHPQTPTTQTPPSTVPTSAAQHHFCPEQTTTDSAATAV